MVKIIELPEEVVKFFIKQGAVLVSTIDAKRHIHCAVKGLVGIEKEGKVFVIDLYSGMTYRNLLKDSKVSITVIDEEHFIGYTLQGRARIVPKEQMQEHIVKEWENRIIQRISKRVVRGVQRGHKTKEYYEVSLPKHPQHLIEVDVERIINLSPPIFT